MSKKEDQANGVEGEVTSQGDAPEFGMMVHKQYIKDFSFENPNAPETLGGGQTQPKMEANINMQAISLDKEKNLYEVVMHVNVTSEREGKVLFHVELQYGLVASVQGAVPEEHHHPLLLIEGPKMAFPFVRQILANTIQSGGYPPLLLNPVNFEELYKKQYLSQQQEQAAGNA